MKKRTPFKKSEIGILMEETLSIIDRMQQAVELGQNINEICKQLDAIDERLNELGSPGGITQPSS